MPNSNLKCSLAECKARLQGIDKMSLDELEEYATRCSTCGSWILKDNPMANETYNKISTRWAEKFNQSLLDNFQA